MKIVRRRRTWVRKTACRTRAWAVAGLLAQPAGAVCSQCRGGNGSDHACWQPSRRHLQQLDTRERAVVLFACCTHCATMPKYASQQRAARTRAPTPQRTCLGSSSCLGTNTALHREEGVLGGRCWECSNEGGLAMGTTGAAAPTARHLHALAAGRCGSLREVRLDGCEADLALPCKQRKATRRDNTRRKHSRHRSIAR